jgi:hypothetical protein
MLSLTPPESAKVKLRRRNAATGFARGLAFLTQNIFAELDAFIADEHGGSGDELAHLVLALAAKRAIERVL